jgi:hypothetical protein
MTLFLGLKRGKEKELKRLEGEANELKSDGVISRLVASHKSMPRNCE